MSNTNSTHKNQAKNGDYYARRETWLRQAIADRPMRSCCKAVSGALFFCFNRTKFDDLGILNAWPSLRTLDAMTGLDRKTVISAVEELQDRGHLKIEKSFDAERRRWRSNSYTAILKEKVVTDVGGVVEICPPTGQDSTRVVDTSPAGGGGHVSTRVVDTYGPDSLNDSLNKDSLKETKSDVFSLEAEFDEFWKIYPHKIGRPKALGAFKKARGTSGGSVPKVSLEDLMAAVAAYAGKTDTRQWCNPATWLDEERWHDRPATTQDKSGAHLTKDKSVSHFLWLEQHACGGPNANGSSPGIHIKCDTPQWRAWREYKGISPPVDRRFGWLFPSEWPPGWPKDDAA